MTESKGIKDLRSKMLSYETGIDPEGNSKAVLVRHIPFGFFEKELLNYFLQFGTVQRTGNHKGWAFVLFTNYEVAQLAAEAMDGYLMFEKRLECKVIKNKDFPSCLRKGPRIIPPPLKNATRKRHAKKLNKIQSGWCEEAAKKRLLKNMEIRGSEFAKLGYQLPPIIGLSETKQIIPVISKTIPMKAEVIKSDDTKSQVPSKRSRKLKKSFTARKTTTD
uniref:RRM domain-containing protein n=1 Tax=Wuchereria bancrofti TaxID=6293 RepID=A0AAF5PPA2_WUCBA